MKTKIIFRMLLVAAALLMGANNVKADTETTIWEGTFDENGAVQINYDTQWYNGLNTNDKLRVYLSNRQVLLYGSYSTYIPFVNAPDGHIDFTSFTTTETGGYFDAVFTQESASTVNSWPDAWGGGQELKVKIGSDLTATQIDYIDASGNVIKNLANNLTLTNNNEISFNAALFNNLAQGKGVRVYVVLNDNIGKIRPYCNSSNVNLLSSSDGFVNCTKQEAIRGYKDITLTSDMKDLLKSNLSLCFGHNGIGIKKVSVITSGSSSKTTPTLTFPQNTYNITYDDSFTGPTATCSVSSLEVRYESSDPSVAEVATYTGAVTIKKAGQVIITARTEASNEYNAASASYTINVAKVNYTLSYSQSEATAVLGQSWTAPTLNNPFNITVTYSSTNTGVATIDENGNVTVVGTGQTTIKANYAGDANHEAKEASYVLTVSAPQPTISFSPDEVNFVFGGTYEAPAVTKTPADASVTYTSSNINVATIDGNGNVVPVGAGSATITGTLANTNVSATYTLNVTAPSRDGAVWTGAEWLGSYGRADYGGGKQPSISTSNLQSAQVGDVIRFYGKLGPLGVDHNEGLGKDFIWRVEVHNPSSWNPALADINSEDSNNSTDNAYFQKGYFDMVVTDNMLDGVNSLTLNGHNLTITAVELIPASAPAKQNVTLTFSATTATATIGETFTEPTLTATSNGETVTLTGITYSSSAPGVATVNESTGAVTLESAGTTTITATFAGNDTYNGASASYTLTVSEATPSANDYIDVSEANTLNHLARFGYRTYVTTEKVDFSRSIGVEAYYATRLNGTVVEFTQVPNTCPEGVPLLLKKKNGATEFKLLKSTAAVPATTVTALLDNKLVAGSTTNGQDELVSGNKKYVLTVHSNNEKDEVVFAEVNIEGARVSATHAYLDLSGTNASGRLRIKLNGESTGISSLQSDERSLDGAVYNLRGQRVEHPTKGLYIINGKKVVIK